MKKIVSHARLSDTEYSDRQCVSGSFPCRLSYSLAPKYLSEISKNITERPAKDWIETYTAHELTKLLSDTRLTLTEIVDRMHLSSQAMLTRYLKRTVGKTPTEYRKQIIQQ